MGVQTKKKVGWKREEVRRGEVQGPRSLVALVGALEGSWASKRKKDEELG